MRLATSVTSVGWTPTDLVIRGTAEVKHLSTSLRSALRLTMLHGHRRNVEGYAAALEEFDHRLPELEARLQPGDLVLITADHGCDPTFKGTDHTREHVPVLFSGPEFKPHSVGIRESFADMGQTIAAHLGLEPLKHGTACAL